MSGVYRSGKVKSSVQKFDEVFIITVTFLATMKQSVGGRILNGVSQVAQLHGCGQSWIVVHNFPETFPIS